MASKPRIKSGKAGRESQKAPRKFQLFYPVLAGCILERNSRPEDSEEVKAERYYDSTIQIEDQPNEFLDLAVCEFSAGQMIKDTKILEISATYFVGVTFGEPPATEALRKDAIKEFVAASAWPMFRDLFIHIGSQSGEELPLLPNAPKLRWIDSRDKVKK